MIMRKKEDASPGEREICSFILKGARRREWKKRPFSIPE